MQQSFDPETMDFYAGDMTQYAEHSMRWKPWGHIEAFMKKLSSGARILELGCGAGRDAREFLDNGFEVTACDGSPAMAEIARDRTGLDVQVVEFSDIDWDQMFDGIWASASLLHVPRPALAGILGKVRQALKPGGLLYASFKAGDIDGRDGLGRYYNYLDPGFLSDAFAQSGPWEDVLIMERDGSSYDGAPTKWLHAFANRA